MPIRVEKHFQHKKSLIRPFLLREARKQAIASLPVSGSGCFPGAKDVYVFFRTKSGVLPMGKDTGFFDLVFEA